MDTRRSQYTLHRIRSSSDPHLAEALAIYVHGLAPTFLTDTNEIVHWLDCYEPTFGDTLLVFTFSVRSKPVGFAHMVYLHAEQIVVADYFVVEHGYRKNNVFFEFADQIREYFRAQAWPVRWVVAEVALTLQPRPGADAALLIRLLKLEGFRVVKAPYYQPILSLNNLESEQPAIMLLAGDQGLERIARETYLEIVATVYTKHYLRWYSIYPAGDQERRTARMNTLKQRISRELGRTKHVELNGHVVGLKLGGAGDAVDTSAAERNLATTAIRVAIALLLALAGGALPSPFRRVVWLVIGAGTIIAVFVWPSSRLRRLLWMHIRLPGRKE